MSVPRRGFVGCAAALAFLSPAAADCRPETWFHFIGVHFRGTVYAAEVKTRALYEKSHEKAGRQILRYMDGLGVSESWLVVAAADLTRRGRTHI